MTSSQSKFKQVTLILIIYTLVVILWGAWVRISHSGDGCGDTWPLCHGKLIPEAEQNKTWVEYGHRFTSGLYGIAVIAFYLWARRLFPKGSLVLKATLATLIFTITEALLGAKLVLFGLVTSNDSLFRAFVMALHQVNSLLLTGSAALAYFSCQQVERKQWSLKPHQYLMLFGFMLIATTGAWAALAGTLFPSTDLVAGLMADFADDSHSLIRLRLAHPLLAILIAGSICLYFYWQMQESQDLKLKKMSRSLLLLFIGGIAFGAATLLLLSPTWMKLTHLLIAQILWISFVGWHTLKSSTR